MVIYLYYLFLTTLQMFFAKLQSIKLKIILGVDTLLLKMILFKEHT